jgi:hypothetical protein
MLRLIISGLLTAAYSPYIGAQTPLASGAHVNVSGYVTDTLSGRSGATALHAAATKANVEAGMAKYAVYDEKTKQLYILEPQATAAAYLELGVRVTVTGTLASSPAKRAGQMVDPQTSEVKDFHSLRARDSTPVAGILTISSIAVAPPPSAARPAPAKQP